MEMRTVLVVDDESAVLRLLATLLRTQGFAVLEAGGGPEALEVAASHDGEIDILITDVNMAPMTGPELAEALRRERPFLPVLFISGYAPSHELVAHEARQERTRFLPKPFTTGALMGVVKGFLDREAAEPASAGAPGW